MKKQIRKTKPKNLSKKINLKQECRARKNEDNHSAESEVVQMKLDNKTEQK